MPGQVYALAPRSRSKACKQVLASRGPRSGGANPPGGPAVATLVAGARCYRSSCSFPKLALRAFPSTRRLWGQHRLAAGHSGRWPRRKPQGKASSLTWAGPRGPLPGSALGRRAQGMGGGRGAAVAAAHCVGPREEAATPHPALGPGKLWDSVGLEVQWAALSPDTAGTRGGEGMLTAARRHWAHGRAPWGAPLP